MKSGISADPLIPIAKVGRAKGLKGEVVVHFYHPSYESFVTCPKLKLSQAQGAPKEIQVRSAQLQGKRWVVSFSDCDDRTQAESLTACEILVAQGDFPELETGLCYPFEFLGLKVRSVTGDDLGEVVDLWQTPANDILVVMHKGQERLFPMVDEVVKEIDLDQGLLVLEPMEDLDAF